MNLQRYKTKHVPETMPGRDSAAHASEHLSEDQIDEELMGDLGPPWDLHLAGCDFCEARVSDAAAPLSDFKTVTLAWGERRSATLPLHQEIARSAGFHPRLARAAAASVALAIGFGISVVAHHERSQTAQVEGRATLSVPTRAADAPSAEGRTEVADSGTSSREKIVRDNQMLKAIDRDLDTPADGAEALGIQSIATVAEPNAAQPLPMQE